MEFIISVCGKFVTLGQNYLHEKNKIQGIIFFSYVSNYYPNICPQVMSTAHYLSANLTSSPIFIMIYLNNNINFAHVHILGGSY